MLQTLLDGLIAGVIGGVLTLVGVRWAFAHDRRQAREGRVFNAAQEAGIACARAYASLYNHPKDRHIGSNPESIEAVMRLYAVRAVAARDANLEAALTEVISRLRKAEREDHRVTMMNHFTVASAVLLKWFEGAPNLMPKPLADQGNGEEAADE